MSHIHFLRRLTFFTTLLIAYSFAICIAADQNTSSEATEDNEAIEISTDAIRNNPDDWMSYFQRGRAYVKLKEFEKAIDDYTHALTLKEHYIIYRNRGVCWIEIKNYKKAISDLTSSIKLEPTFSEVYNDRANAYSLIGDFKKALIDYTKAIELNPEEPGYFYNRGINWEENGDDNKAINDYSRSIELDPISYDAYNNRGLLYLKLKDLYKATLDFRKATQLNPVRYEAIYNLGLVWEEKKAWKEAVENFKKASEICVDCKKVYNSLAWLLATCNVDQLRDGKKAVEYANKLLTIDSYYPFLDTAAAAYAEIGDFDKAKELQTQAISSLTMESDYNDNKLIIYKKRLALYKTRKPWRE